MSTPTLLRRAESRPWPAALPRRAGFARTLRCLVAGLAVAAGATGPVRGADEAERLRDLQQRIEKIEAELQRLRGGQPAPVAARERKVLALLESPVVAQVFTGTPEGTRIFAARLLFVNLGAQPVVVKGADIALDVDGTTLTQKPIPAQAQYQGIALGGTTHPLRNLAARPEIRVPASGTDATWVLFLGLPAGNQVPKLVLKYAVDGKAERLDVNAHAAGLLGLSVARIGPQQSLGLATIDGTINPINAGALAEALDKLAQDKVTRAVIAFGAGAQPPDPIALGWLQQAAATAGRNNGNNPQPGMPEIPAVLRELHLAAIPAPGGGTVQPPATGTRIRRGPRGPYASAAPDRIHDTAGEAVTAALRSAFEVLPRDQLLKEIEEGHPLARVAAVSVGGGRLPDEQLPRLLALADDKDPQIQAAALVALRHFGDEKAVAKLVEHAKRNAPNLGDAALESLVASRFSAAHEGLLGILANEPPASRKTIVELLAEHPRPIWSETIYGYLKDPDPQVSAGALDALVRIGHPKLFETLRGLLAVGTAPQRTQAFAALAARTDPESETVAMDYTLRWLATKPPESGPMQTLLQRTKDQRAVPLLMSQLDKSPAQRTQIVQILAQIGDERVASAFVELFPKLPNNEKTAVLAALMQFKSPSFRKLAGECLLTTDFSLVSTACQGLQNDGSDEAVKLLVDAFETSKNSSTWSYVSNALANLGTSAAQQALSRAKNSPDANKKRYAQNALRNLRQRSPGYQYIYQAEAQSRNKQWKEAVTQYGLALEFDSLLPEAYAGRAHALMKLDKVKEAGADYRKALELDSSLGLAATGLAVVQVLEGDVDAGIKTLEDSRSRVEQDALFHYNAACVYGRAAEAAAKSPASPARDARLAEHRKAALTDLEKAVKSGFMDLEWMKQDPDLKSLADDPQFKKLASGMTP